jgi:hypothetical protein
MLETYEDGDLLRSECPILPLKAGKQLAELGQRQNNYPIEADVRKSS